MTDHTLTRRALIVGTGAALAGTALAVPYVNVVQADDVSLPVGPVARYEAAVAEFRAAAEALYPDIANWTVNAADGGVIVFGYRPPKPVEYSGFGVYEIQMGKRRPVVALAASATGRSYFRQLYWRDRDGNDRFQGAVIRTSPSAFSIVRKIRSLA